MQTASFEALGRLKKVNALCAKIDHFVAYVGLHPNRDGNAIAEMLRHWPDHRWRELAVSVGKIPPSSETIREVVALYRRRAVP